MAEVLTDEGRLIPWRKVKPDFFVRDHLGSVRAVVSGDGRVLETNNYYPYGMQIKPLSQTYYTGSDVKNRYKYNGKEEFTDNGLDWLAYGKRFYDPVVARFWDLDPLADTFAYVTPYNYAENSPVANIDLWGTQKVPVKDYITEGMRFAGLSEDYIQEVNKFRAQSGATATVLSVAAVASPMSFLSKSKALKTPVAKVGASMGVDFTAQMTANGGDIQQWNITQTMVSGALSIFNVKKFNLIGINIGGAALSSALEVRPKGTYTVLLGKNKKDIKTFVIQTSVGSVSNIAGDAAVGNMKTTAEAVFNQLPNVLPYTVSNIVQNNLTDKTKKINQTQ